VSDWKISPADSNDAPLLAQVLGDWVRETGWMPVLHSRAEDIGFVSGLIESHEVRVARGAKGPFGFLAARGGDVAALYLAPSGRGFGIGKALLDEIKAKEHEIRLWTFQANTRAISFYLREGFVEAEQTDGTENDERLPDVRLIWRRAL
jgi:GNAT superfamily N-acetyltransferase